MFNKNKSKQIIVTEKDLPLSCPPKIDNQNNKQSIWDSHPIIYLPIKEKKSFTCPYCGIEYIYHA